MEPCAPQKYAAGAKFEIGARSLIPASSFASIQARQLFRERHERSGELIVIGQETPSRDTQMNKTFLVIAALAVVAVTAFAVLSGKPNNTPSQHPETAAGGSAPLANEGTRR
jgi:hypothetical protein